MSRFSLRYLIAIVTVCACTKAPKLTPEEKLIANAMEGVWSVRLSRADIPTNIDGEIALLPNSSISSRYAHVSAVTNFGSYNIDFSKLGFDSPERGRPTTALAGPYGNDSITILLSPNRDDISLRLSGRRSSESIEGNWVASFSRAGAISGRFVMAKIQ